jgi:hypothetical protein
MAGILERKPRSGHHNKTKGEFLDLVTLVRSIQRAEGNPDCYRRPSGECERLDCAWRRHCLENPRSSVPGPSWHGEKGGKESS